MMDAIRIMLGFKAETAAVTVDPAVFASALLHAIGGVELHAWLVCGYV